MQGNVCDEAEEVPVGRWSFVSLSSAPLGSSIFHSCSNHRPRAAAGTKATGIKGLLQVPWGSKGSPGEDKKELERVLLTWGCCLRFDTHTESNCKRGEEGSPQLKLSFIPCGELKTLREEHGQAPRPKAQTRGTKQAERIYKAAIENIVPFQRAPAEPQDTERERHPRQQNVC